MKKHLLVIEKRLKMTKNLAIKLEEIADLLVSLEEGLEDGLCCCDLVETLDKVVDCCVWMINHSEADGEIMDVESGKVEEVSIETISDDNVLEMIGLIKVFLSILKKEENDEMVDFAIDFFFKNASIILGEIEKELVRVSVEAFKASLL